MLSNFLSNLPSNATTSTTSSAKYRVKLFAVCSEGQSEANLAMEEWKLQHFTSLIGDNHNRLVKHLQNAFLPSLVITDCSNKHNPHGLNGKDYPHGAVQPGVLFLVNQSSEGKTEHKPVFAWACQPSLSNLMGSTGRPSAREIWKDVHEKAQLYYKAGQRDIVCSTDESMPKPIDYKAIYEERCCCVIL